MSDFINYLGKICYLIVEESLHPTGQGDRQLVMSPMSDHITSNGKPPFGLSFFYEIHVYPFSFMII